MKKIVSTIVALSLAASGVAQSYTGLWKKVDDAVTNDLPKTALDHARTIREKAAGEHNDAQYIKARLTIYKCQAEVSPDSAQAELDGMEGALSQTASPVTRALWYNALGVLYRHGAGAVSAGSVDAEKLRARGLQYLLKALDDPEATASARIDDYLPLFKKGYESRYFGNDLLHVIYRSYFDEVFRAYADTTCIPTISRLRQFYLHHGNRDAALLLSLDSLKVTYPNPYVVGRLDEDPCYRALADLRRDNADNILSLRVIERMIDLQRAYSGDLNQDLVMHNDSLLVTLVRGALAQYAHTDDKAALTPLRQFLLEMEAGRATLGSLSDSYLPDEKVDLTLRSRNLKEATLLVYPLYTRRSDYDLADSKERDKQAARRSKAGTKTVLTTSEAPIWQWQTQTVALAAPTQPGVYRAELRCGGKTQAYSDFSVSHVYPLTFSVRGDTSRIVVVDARTGHPMSGVRVTAYDLNTRRQTAAYTTDDNGIIQVAVPNYRTPIAYYATTLDDAAAPSIRRSYYGYHGGDRTEERAQTVADLFADRAIYRPGQTLQFSGVVYTRQGDDYHTEALHEARVTLYDVNHKKVDSLLVRTDEWGTLSGSFTLPAVTLSGSFTLELRSGAVASALSVRVEEYKRPTLTAETDPVKVAYTLGDTISVRGTAKSYSGVAIAGAKVKYTVRRRQWFYTPYSRRDKSAQTGEVLTDSEGRFSMPVVLTANERERQPRLENRFYYTLTYTVTADNGETVEGSTVLQAAGWKARLVTDMPDRLCKERLPQVTVKQLNAAEQDMTAGGEWILSQLGREVLHGTFESGKAFSLTDWAKLPSGNYEWVVRTPDALKADTTQLVLFSVADTRPADRFNALFTYHHTSEAGDSTYIMVGTKAPDAILFYDFVAADGRILESRHVSLSDSLTKLALTYSPEYGDGATACFAMVRDGHLYDYFAQVCKPVPDKRLLLNWSTFRSRLTPGSREEWRLRVTRPDGTPATAQVLAGMYDASLDAFARNDHSFGYISFYRYLTTGRWDSSGDGRQEQLEAYLPAGKRLTMPERTYTEWQSQLLSVASPYQALLFGVMPRSQSVATDVAEMSTVNGVAFKSARSKPMMRVAGGATEMAKEAESGTTVSPRTNFAETAFFMPSLVTDDKGEVSISFTLPESMTRWNFSALAHDHVMNYGRLDTTLVARKDFMVVPALPRFVRSGDKTMLPVKVTNLSDRTVRAKLHFTLSDAVHEKSKAVLDRTVDIEVPAGESRLFSFPYEVTIATELLRCRTVAEGDGFSDGEEHYLPVLSDRVRVTRTLPFSLTKRGDYHFRLDTLFAAGSQDQRSLTVELTSHPLWYAVTALPALAGNAYSLSATEWSTRYYALSLGKMLAGKYPEVCRLATERPEELATLAKVKLDNLTDETPWLYEAQQEASRGLALKQLFDEGVAAANLQTALDKLKALQRPDGAWSWYPGMPGNAYITVDVAILLARTQKLAGSKQADALFLPAYDYLKKTVAKQVAEMREEETSRKIELAPSELQLRYLYLRSLLGERPDGDADFLIKRAVKLRQELTMYGKSVMAVVLAEAGRETEAKENLNSLLEHTVVQPGMGRFFDTPRAEYSWQSYRIPTQCAALEALQYFGRDSIADELRLWLLQSKRTQMWETSRATTDAVYALLTAPTETQVGRLGDEAPLYFTLTEGDKIVGFNAASDAQTPTTTGYYRANYTDRPATEATGLTVRKAQDGLSWGSVYAACTVSADEVRTEGKGLMLSQRMEVLQGTAWTPLSSETLLKAGDRVRRVFTLTADRDYDFVQLDAARPACLEPARPLSGYQWSEGLPAYRVVRDAEMTYYIERVSKGTHQMTEELFVDRAGIYHSGTAKVSCVYAPEFCGTAAQTTLRTE